MTHVGHTHSWKHTHKYTSFISINENDWLDMKLKIVIALCIILVVEEKLKLFLES